MIYITRIYHRKDINTSWYKQSTEYAAHLKENFLDNKRIEKYVSEESKDKLSLITLTIFSSKEDIETFKNDPICVEHMSSRAEYYATNNIVSENPIMIEK